MSGSGALCLLLALPSAAASPPPPGPRLANLRTEYLENPLGLELSPPPRFSWELLAAGGARGVRQLRYTLELGVFGAEPHLLWSSGAVNSNATTVAYAGPALQPATAYEWAVTVSVGAAGGAGGPLRSERAVFSTGMRRADWSAEAIGMRSAGRAEAPWFRHTFPLPAKQPDIALLYVASLGFCDAFLNGHPVSEAVLSPSVSFLPGRVMYRVYNVSQLLRAGAPNTLGLWAAAGWADYFSFTTPGNPTGAASDDVPAISPYTTDGQQPFKAPLVMAELHLHSGGSVTKLATDERWECSLSSVSRTGEFGIGGFAGDAVDDRKSIDWSSPPMEGGGGGGGDDGDGANEDDNGDEDDEQKLELAQQQQQEHEHEYQRERGRGPSWEAAAVYKLAPSITLSADVMEPTVRHSTVPAVKVTTVGGSAADALAEPAVASDGCRTTFARLCNESFASPHSNCVQCLLLSAARLHAAGCTEPALATLCGRPPEPPGPKHIIEMAELFTGWFRFSNLKAAPNTTVTFHTSTTEGLHVEYNQADSFTLGPSGVGSFEPRFSYHEVHYITVYGLSEPPFLADVVGYRLTSNFSRNGEFECSSDLLTRIYETTVNNYRGITTGGTTVDCPHRERRGYGGDGHSSYEFAQHNFATGAFHTKWARDFADIQTPTGEIAHTAPQVSGGGGPAWSGFAVTLPWEQYRSRGDTQLLASMYPTMKRLLGFYDQKTNASDGLLHPWSSSMNFLADWNAPWGCEGEGESPANLLLNNAYRHYITVLVAKIAKLLGHDGDAATYAAAATRLAAAINTALYNESTGVYVDMRQTHLIMPLATGVVPQAAEARVTQNLEKAIHGCGDPVLGCGHVDTGLTATYFLIKHLTETGRNDLIFTMANQTTFPSYGFFLEKGLTTWPEDWHVSTGDSLMHGCYNSIGIWPLEGIAGIKVDASDPECPLTIRAGVDTGDVTWARGSRKTLRGQAQSSWTVGAHGFRHEVTVPANEVACVLIPCADAACAVEEGGVSVHAGVSGVSVKETTTVNKLMYLALRVESGDYDFSSTWVRDSSLWAYRERVPLRSDDEQTYTASVVSFAATPVVSYLANTSRFLFAFNPSWVLPSAGTDNKAGLLIRVQNCSVDGFNRSYLKSCGRHCAGGPGGANGDPGSPSHIAFAELLNGDGCEGDVCQTPRFAPIDKDSVVFQPSPNEQSEARGTEDPRMTYDKDAQLYYLLYSSSYHTHIASSKDPTKPDGWTRHGQICRAPGKPCSKSGALLLSDDVSKRPHLLFHTAGQIYVTHTTEDVTSGQWANSTLFISGTAWGNPFVESGPPPMRLSTGDFVYFINSWHVPDASKGEEANVYQPSWVILSGEDPTKIIARAQHPLWVPTKERWMAGHPSTASEEVVCNTAEVAFVEAAHPLGGDAFRLYFGGADAVVGTAMVRITHSATATSSSVADISLTSAAGVDWTLSSGPQSSAVESAEPVGAVSVPALVPGDVNDDLQNAGVLPDLFVADNCLETPWWVPLRTWTYTAAFPSPTLDGKRVDLRFEGVDFNASFELNGVPIGHHTGSFVPAEFEVSGHLRRASTNNTLTVTIHPPPSQLIQPLYNGSTPMYGTDHCLERQVWPMWKSVLNQWDFAPKYWQIGIWRGVSLHVRPSAKSASSNAAAGGASLQTLPTVLPHLSPPYTSAELEMRAAVMVEEALVGTDLTLEWSVSCTTDVSAPTAVVRSTVHATAASVETAANASAVLKSPRLWWPNGYGRQHRYKLTVKLLSGSVVLDETEAKFGVRHLENLENDHQPSWEYNRYGDGGCGPCLWNSSLYPMCNRTDVHVNLTCSAQEAQEYPSPSRWLFAVNGRRVFARGGNWVPADMAFGRIVREKARFRGLLAMARDLGYTYIRIWGGGLIEDQQFYDYADEFGIMLQQDFPLAGCGFSQQNASWDWLTQPIATADGESVLGAFEKQLPVALKQLANHPSIVRYTLGNELYQNRTQCPVEKVFEDTLRSLDPTRMTRQADPTTNLRAVRLANPKSITISVGQRHGPYHFDVVGGAGYDAWGGRWPEVGSCSSANFDSAECCNGNADHSQPGCRYNTHDGGPGDPFEWSEFGSNAMSDIETLRHVMPADSLTPAAVGNAMWATHKAGMWLDQGLWTAAFAPASTTAASAFRTMTEIVEISQWIQAEAYRFAYQAGRRRKWHRSLMASWTFDEPWPNAAHGCVIDYYGLPKHAFYSVRQSMAMLDVSLSYSNIHSAPGQQLQATVWVDSELDFERRCTVVASFFTPAGADLGSENITDVQVKPDASTKLSQLKFTPTSKLLGDVVIVRLDLRCATGSGGGDELVATNDYTFGVRSPPSPPPPVKGCDAEVGFDWHPDTGTAVAAKDSAACCKACSDKPGCKVGVLFGQDCYLKTAAQAVTKYARSGRTSCMPKHTPAVVGGTAPGVAGPLRALLDVANTTLALTLGGNASAPVLRATAADAPSPCALYVKPTLRNASGHQLGYVSFSRGFTTLRPGEAAEMRVASEGFGAATHGCVEAWNAPRVCVPL